MAAGIEGYGGFISRQCRNREMARMTRVGANSARRVATYRDVNLRGSGGLRRMGL